MRSDNCDYSKTGYRWCRCRQCGKEFAKLPEWVYKLGGKHTKYFCTYSCLNKYRGEHKCRQ